MSATAVALYEAAERWPYFELNYFILFILPVKPVERNQARECISRLSVCEWWRPPEISFGPWSYLFSSRRSRRWTSWQHLLIISVFLSTRAQGGIPMQRTLLTQQSTLREEEEVRMDQVLASLHGRVGPHVPGKHITKKKQQGKYARWYICIWHLSFAKGSDRVNWLTLRTWANLLTK